ncbi:hypothetical protein A9308_06175 [Moraxella atlantae]|nr:hypothetical protein [Moraxella atlantae]OBX78464.1 hypothetical protein A9308_06175 [Moraxella atlantae]OPH35306.1 hypothetical protein B5J92_05080 [Moraxella atlantae]
MAEQEEMYQREKYEERTNKMLGKPNNCKQNFTNNNNVVYKDGHKVPNFSYLTPDGEPCLP